MKSRFWRRSEVVLVPTSKVRDKNSRTNDGGGGNKNKRRRRRGRKRIRRRRGRRRGRGRKRRRRRRRGRRRGRGRRSQSGQHACAPLAGRSWTQTSDESQSLSLADRPSTAPARLCQAIRRPTRIDSSFQTDSSVNDRLPALPSSFLVVCVILSAPNSIRCSPIVATSLFDVLCFWRDPDAKPLTANDFSEILCDAARSRWTSFGS